MAESTNIGWTDATFNGWIGCTRVGPGCDHCYAASSTPARTMGIVWGPGELRRRTGADNWSKPRAWNAAHQIFQARYGRRRRVFCSSLSDVFDNQVDPAWRADLWALIRETPHLDWLIVTKRIGNAAAMLPPDWGDGWAHVWLGVTVVNQQEADRDIPKLLATPAQLRFLSIEPLLGPIDLLAAGDVLCRCDGCLSMARQHPGAPGLRRIDWVICGGESGPGARPMDLQWATDLQRQCADASVPFFFKQVGGSYRDKGGCLLHGSERKAWPESPAAYRATAAEVAAQDRRRWRDFARIEKFAGQQGT